MRNLYFLAVTVGLAAPCLTHAEVTCAIPQGATHRAYSDLPPGVSRSLALTFSSIASEGQPFNLSDVVQMKDGKPVPNVRVLFVWQRESRWVVGFEQGGRGYHTGTLGFDIKSGVAAFPIFDGSQKDRNTCAEADALISDL